MFMPTSELSVDSGAQTADLGKHFPITLERVCFAAPEKEVIKSISLSFADVPCTAVIGHNGAGKSVLLRLMHGLLKPTSGIIRWGSHARDEETLGTAGKQAMVFQKPLLLNRSVAANLSFVLKRQGLKGEQCRLAVEEYLALADMRQAANRPAKVLSGGEAQRLAIVRALAMKPQLLFLDEPTASLDPGAKAGVERLLKNIMDKGVRLVLVTQDIGQAGRLANRIVVMHQGRVVEHGQAEQVLEKPGTPEASAFLSHQI